MKVLTVTQVNTYIKALLDEIPQIKNVYICGEISNFKHYYNSGHMYFTLKDEKSRINAVMFSGDNYKLKFKPDNGMKVICFGQVGVYERDGVYQLYCRDMQPEGIGALTVAYEQLKEKLDKLGYFNPDIKKDIPKFPRRVGVATSKMGAAVEDIKNVISRRFPLCEIVIVPTAVQGEAAQYDIANSIKFLDEKCSADVIIVGRGGGSLEDLWAFNTQTVADAVYNCKTPVISAVGHETDYTICDFTADLRAPTPSAAAELAVPDINSLLLETDNYKIALDNSIMSKISACETEYYRIKQYFLSNDVSSFYDAASVAVASYSQRLKSLIDSRLQFESQRLHGIEKQIDYLNPQNVMKRGYALAFDCDSNLILSAADVEKNDTITVKINDGSLKACVTEVKYNGSKQK